MAEDSTESATVSALTSADVRISTSLRPAATCVKTIATRSADCSRAMSDRRADCGRCRYAPRHHHVVRASPNNSDTLNWFRPPQHRRESTLTPTPPARKTSANDHFKHFGDFFHRHFTPPFFEILSRSSGAIDRRLRRGAHLAFSMTVALVRPSIASGVPYHMRCSTELVGL